MNEAGADRVAAVVEESAMSVVHLGEVVSFYAQKGATRDEIRETIDLFSVRFVPVDVDLAFDAGMLRAGTARFGPSLGDRFCLALGRREGAKILTADRVRAKAAAGIGVEVEPIR